MALTIRKRENWTGSGSEQAEDGLWWATAPFIDYWIGGFATEQDAELVANAILEASGEAANSAAMDCSYFS